MTGDIRIDRRPVHSQIADHLRDLIVAGELKPGEALPGERELAARFSVSRNSLRQAISYLEAMGHVQTRHGAGVFVSEGSSEATIARFADVLLDPRRSMLDVIEGRLAVEPMTAALAARRRTDDDLIEIAQYARVPHDADPSVAPGHFHPRVARATHNPVLIGIQRALVTGPSGVSELLALEPEAAQQWDAAHRHIHEAIRDKDPAAAELLMKQHLEHVLEICTRYSTPKVTS